jgi:hypothetical protein
MQNDKKKWNYILNQIGDVNIDTPEQIFNKLDTVLSPNEDFKPWLSQLGKNVNLQLFITELCQVAMRINSTIAENVNSLNYDTSGWNDLFAKIDKTSEPDKIFDQLEKLQENDGNKLSDRESIKRSHLLTLRDIIKWVRTFNKLKMARIERMVTSGADPLKIDEAKKKSEYMIGSLWHGLGYTVTEADKKTFAAEYAEEISDETDKLTKQRSESDHYRDRVINDTLLELNDIVEEMTLNKTISDLTEYQKQIKEKTPETSNIIGGQKWEKLSKDFNAKSSLAMSFSPAVFEHVRRSLEDIHNPSLIVRKELHIITELCRARRSLENESLNVDRTAVKNR